MTRDGAEEAMAAAVEGDGGVRGRRPEGGGGEEEEGPSPPPSPSDPAAAAPTPSNAKPNAAGDDANIDVDVDDHGGGNRIDLFNEVEHCLDDSELIYEICAVRKLAREGGIDADTLRTPISLAEGYGIILDNEEVLMRALGGTDYAACVGRLENCMNRSRERMERMKSRRGGGGGGGGSTDDPYDEAEVGGGVVLAEVGDMHQDEELVYYIVVDHHHRLVKVVFRGSATLADFQTDAHLAMREIPNPVPMAVVDIDVDEEEAEAEGAMNADDDERRPRSEPSRGTGSGAAPMSIKIHAGFYQYLFARPPQAGESTIAATKKRMVPMPGVGGVDRRDASGRENHPPIIELPTKCDYILNQTACILGDNPGYRLVTTGHSLGGALSTLFAFEAATVAALAGDDNHRLDIPTPVTCVNVASPMVGNVAFCRAFRSLEERGLLRQLRVVNVEDLVPRGPTRGVINDFGFLCRARNVYKHVGMKLQLSSELERRPSYVITYRNVPDHFVLFCVVLITDVQRFFLMTYLCVCGCLCYRGLRFHSCDEYWDRVRANRDELEELTLDDLYDSVLRGGQRGIIHRGGGHHKH